MLNKRLTVILLASLVVVAALVYIFTGTTKENAHIRFSWWGNELRHEATIEVINMYMKKHPHVTIEAEYRVNPTKQKSLLSLLVEPLPTLSS